MDDALKQNYDIKSCWSAISRAACNKHGVEDQYYFKMVAIYSPEPWHHIKLRSDTRTSPLVIQM
jgi:hypothetical protein